MVQQPVATEAGGDTSCGSLLRELQVGFDLHPDMQLCSQLCAFSGARIDKLSSDVVRIRITCPVEPLMVWRGFFEVS